VATVLVVLGVVAGFGYWLGHRQERVPLPSLGPDCQVEAGGDVRLEREQMANAATIAAVGVRLGMPERAVVVAIATALQESKLRNLPHLGRQNDHDSVGLFQQRPSQGWGSVEQVSDPRYASERFYLALRQVRGWQEMRVTDAAQRVQRSAFPEAYERWADDARVLATALLGRSGAAVACSVPEDPPLRGEAAAGALGSALVADWGEQASFAPSEPAGVSISAADQPTGWQYAHWLVAHAANHGVTRVQFADLEWTAELGAWEPAGSKINHVLAEVAPGG
jgi:hypothetical protein